MTAMALSWLDADVDASNNTTQELWPQPGSPVSSITFSAIAKPMTSKVTAVINMTTFKEIDATTGALIAGGCTSALTGLNLFLQQNAAPPRLASPGDPTDNTGPSPSGTAQMTKDAYRSHVDAMESSGALPIN